jgi:hypothetical protein
MNESLSCILVRQQVQGVIGRRMYRADGPPGCPPQLLIGIICSSPALAMDPSECVERSSGLMHHRLHAPACVAADAVLTADRADRAFRVALSEVTAIDHDCLDRSSKRYVSIRVQDNGIGMNAVVRQRAFEPFFTTKRPGKGSDLGLATSYGIVRDHGGTITLESAEGGGTLAEVLLPITRQASEGAHSEAPRALENRRGTILVVADEPAVRRVLELLLVERGHGVELADDGPGAIARLDAGLRPDLPKLASRAGYADVDQPTTSRSVTSAITQSRNSRPTACTAASIRSFARFRVISS